MIEEEKNGWNALMDGWVGGWVTYLAEKAFTSTPHGEGIVDVHVVVLGVHWFLHQGFVDLRGRWVGGWVGRWVGGRR